MRLLIILAGLAALVPTPAFAQSSSPPAAQTPRQILPLHDGWRFRFGETGEAPTGASFDDSGWEQVSVPHSWNRIGEYTLTRSAATNNKQGVGWYRLKIDAPPAAKGKRHYLDFAGVGNIADVWVNGVHAGQHKGAFGRFRFDVTPQWKPGAANLIAVKADNSKREPGSSTSQTIPLAGDFFVHGGIYRAVSLVTANDVGIDLLDYGGQGVYIATDRDEAKASVRVRTRLRNAGPGPRRLALVTTISDAAGKSVASASASVNAKASAATETAQLLQVADPDLWDGRDRPYLYTATVEVREGAALIDRVTQTFGFRSIRFDPNQGFFLNNQHVKLHGVSRHQDKLGKGWALSPADHAEDMALIKELGANTVRHAHYQHADQWSDEADKAGMIVWAELPYVTTPSLDGGQGTPELWKNAETQLRELIRQNYNHPSIAMWSIGNEVDSAKGFGKAEAKPLALLRHLQKVAREEDPTRPTVFADCCEDLNLSFGGGGEPLAGTADMIGYNRYFGWYMPKPLEARAQFSAHLDKLHAKHPTLPVSISEYGAGGAPGQHSDNVRGGFLNYIGRPQPEEFESFVHEETWPAIRERPYIFASWVWAMFDFASDLRDEGDAVDLNTKGLVTADRKTKKDAFYYYKAQWNREPMIHLTGKRHAERAYPLIEVKAYSNAERAMLTLNGAAVGETACADRICVWPGVTLRPGANEAVVTAQAGGKTVTDSATWTGPDPAQGVRIEAGDIATRVSGGRRFGSDNFVTGGEPVILNLVGFGGRSLAPRRDVAAPEPELYEYWREGEAFSYAIPLPDGKWRVTIHSFEPRKGEAEAVTMSVAANGKAALKPFSVLKEAGGPLKGLAKSFPITVRGGTLKLDFAGQGGKAVVAAIEVTRR